MLVGYARVSTSDQTLNLQHDALTAAGCTRIFTDTASGAQAERKGLTDVLSYVRAGDTLVVWKLDRLGRSLKDLITRITDLHTRGVGFKSHPFQGDAVFPTLRDDGSINKVWIGMAGCSGSGWVGRGRARDCEARF